MMVVMAGMVVLRRGKCRRGNHHNEQGGEQKSLHGCIVAPALLRKSITFGEQLRTRIKAVNRNTPIVNGAGAFGPELRRSVNW
jgi:hypothetical protein